jgi:hypothetical protein
MARYFLQDTPLASFERMMTQTPRPARGGEESYGDQAERNAARRRTRQTTVNERRFCNKHDDVKISLCSAGEGVNKA